VTDDAARPRPAFTRESQVLRLPGAVTLDDLSPEWAWGGATGAGVRVAVIDSGIEADHPALEGCVDVEEGLMVEVADDGSTIDHPGPHDDSFGHATGVAGIIHSLAPEARITSVKVLGPGLGGKAAAFLRGLGWAVEQGFDVINLSLGTNRREWALAFYEVCDQAYFRDCFVVTAANNVLRPSFPSLFGSVTSVACNLATDPFRFHWNPDPPTEFLAPGVDVDVAWLGGGRLTTTGNSFAAPHIAGIAALIRSKHPELRSFQMKTVLWATAANVRDARQAVPVAGRLSRVTRATTSARATAALGGVVRRAPMR
jgi:subtilisin family serine protease